MAAAVVVNVGKEAYEDEEEEEEKIGIGEGLVEVGDHC